MDLIVMTPTQVKALINEAVERAFREAVQVVIAELHRHGPKEWLTNAEASAYLGLSKTTMQRYRSAGTLPFSKIGGTIYYRRSDLIHMLEHHRQNTSRG